MSAGKRIITLYFLIFYLLPLVGNFFLKQYIVSIYNIYPITQVGFFSMLFIYISYYFLEKIHIHLPVPTITFNYIENLYNKNRLGFGIFSLVIACYCFYAGFTSYRYQYEGLSTQSNVILFSLVLHTLLIIDLFYHIFCDNQEINKKSYFENILLALSNLILAGGVGDVFFGLNACLYSFYPSLFKRLFFYKYDYPYKKTLLTLSVIIELVILVFAYCGGNIIKISSSHQGIVQSFHEFKKSVTPKTDLITERANPESQNAPTGAVTQINDNNFSRLKHYYEKGFNFIVTLIERTSINYYSFTFTSQTPEYAIKQNIYTPILLPLKDSLFRANVLLGKPFKLQKPEISSISQLNFQLLLKDQDKFSLRQGSSPGLIGSFNYIFPTNWVLILCPLYLWFMSKWIDILLYRKTEKFSLIACLISLNFIEFIFASPFDFLTIFDNSTIMLFILLCLSFIKYKKLKTHENYPLQKMC